jgi:hypothetical protein
VVEEECDESAYWMEMILACKLLKRAKLNNLLAEANELLAITVASIKTARRGRDAQPMTLRSNPQSTVRNPQLERG